VAAIKAVHPRREQVQNPKDQDQNPKPNVHSPTLLELCNSFQPFSRLKFEIMLQS
jgi:hypothetical protein